MDLATMRANVEIELQSAGEVIWTDLEIARAVQKSVALMSRLIPKRAIVETTITVEVTDETLTIASNTGTLTYKPVKVDSLSIPDKTLDTHYTINYLTGVVTEIGSGLPDAAYTVDYEIDPYMMDISTLLSDYIKIERIEYPVGDTPPTIIVPLQEVYATYLTFKETLEEDKHIRITYLTYWTAPTESVAGDFPRSLDNAVIIGSVGQCLIFKAELYMQTALTETTDTITLLDTIGSLSLSAPSLTPPTAPTLSTLTPPSVYTVVKPSAPSLPSAPTAPTAPTLSFTTFNTAMTAIGTEITAAKAHHTTGAALANIAAVGDRPAWVYAEYANGIFRAADSRVQEAIARLREQEDALAKYASEVTSYGSDVNQYANEVSGTVGIYREQINGELLGINNVNASVARYAAEIAEDRNMVDKFLGEVRNYQAQVAEYQQEVAAYTANTMAIVNRALHTSNQVRNYIDIAGRYLASGQAKINEMLVMLGLKPEYNMYKSSSEQFS